MMFLSRMMSGSCAYSLTWTFPTALPTLLVGVEDGRDVDPVLREDGRACDRLPEPPRPDERDVVLALRPQDLADLAEQRVDVVADPALAELAEGGEVAADLGRVDVGVVGDLLRGNPVLAHLLRLGQDLQIPRQPRRDPNGQPIRHTHSLCRCL